MCTYSKMCLLIKMGGVTLCAVYIYHYEDDDFVKNEILHDQRNADSKYISKLIMTKNL